MIRLTHFSGEPLVFDPARTYAPVKDRFLSECKPPGIWLSDESAERSWSDWVRSEYPDGYEQFPLDHRTAFDCETIALYQPHPPGNPTALLIDTDEALEKFCDEYLVPGLVGRHPDWERICGDFAGIVISPWRASRTHGDIWYYTWDCAGGVVWDLAALRVVQS